MSGDLGSSQEFRVYGPPGTGKTTWLARVVANTAESRRTDRLLVCSFTRAAAVEVAGRGLPVDPANVGTLHAMGYRALGRPPVAEERIEEFNSRFPHRALSGVKGTDDGSVRFKGSGPGDENHARMDQLRNRMVPLETWPVGVRGHHRDWCVWKADAGVVDFTDMVELCLSDVERAPGNPVVGFFDEVQDSSPLEVALIRSWGRSMDRIVLVGDDDQAIYGFRGADPSSFLRPEISEENKRVLRQSYRVPREVHAVAVSWVGKLSVREPKEYVPRDADGSVLTPNIRGASPDPLLDLVEDRIVDGRSVMVLAACGYMLDRIKYRMRERGIPFHNPYRRTRKDWNPLGERKGQTSSARRLEAFLTMHESMGADIRVWTGDDVRLWSTLVRKTGVFRRNSARLIDELPSEPLSFAQLSEVFESSEVAQAAIQGDLRWLESNLLASQKGVEFPIAIARRAGARALSERPLVTIGTIHSVKGGQADSVIVLPDLSQQGMRQWLGRPADRDSIIRQFYVAMTRARDELIVAQPSGRAAVRGLGVLR